MNSHPIPGHPSPAGLPFAPRSGRDRGAPRLELGLHAREGLVTPLGELAWNDADPSAECVGRLAAEDAQDDLRLVSWFLHGVVQCALESHTGVSGNRAAQQG